MIISLLLVKQVSWKPVKVINVFTKSCNIDIYEGPKWASVTKVYFKFPKAATRGVL